jgi:hypothetical protein
MLPQSRAGKDGRGRRGPKEAKGRGARLMVCTHHTWPEAEVVGTLSVGRDELVPGGVSLLRDVMLRTFGHRAAVDLASGMWLNRWRAANADVDRRRVDDMAGRGWRDLDDYLSDGKGGSLRASNTH